MIWNELKVSEIGKVEGVVEVELTVYKSLAGVTLKLGDQLVRLAVNRFCVEAKPEMVERFFVVGTATLAGETVSVDAGPFATESQAEEKREALVAATFPWSYRSLVVETRDVPKED